MKSQNAVDRPCGVGRAPPGYQRCPGRVPDCGAGGRGPDGAVDKLFDVTLAELARTARERNLPLRHPVLSVYSGLIRMTFDIDDEVIAIAGNRRCAIPKVLQVRILPTGRAGSSASEILQQSCLSWREGTSKSTLKPMIPRSTLRRKFAGRSPCPMVEHDS